MTAKPTRYYGIGLENPGDRINDMLQRSQIEYLFFLLSIFSFSPFFLSFTWKRYLKGKATGEEEEEVPNQEQLDQIQLGQEFGRYLTMT